LMLGSLAVAEDYEPVTIIQANWGQGYGEFGLSLEAEGNCPQSLSVDDRGNFAILDAVNSRVQLYSSLGNWLKNISISTRAFDVKYVENKIYVLAPYDYLIEEFDHIGKFIKRVEINRKIDLIDGLRLDENQVCVQTYEQKQYRVGGNVSRDMQIQSEQAGFTAGVPELRFQTRWLDQRRGALLIENSQTNKLETITINTTDRLGSIIFLDTDKDEYIYLRLELFGDDGKPGYEIQKLNYNGDLVSQFQIQNNNIVMPYRPVTVDNDGNVYSMEIRTEGFSVVKWRVKK